MKVDAPLLVDAVLPGQFVNVYLPREDLLLPRPISICDSDMENEVLTLVYAVVGEGTLELSRLIGYGEEPTVDGVFLEIFGPHGNGFFYDNSYGPRDEVLLIGGGLGVAPLLFAARVLADGHFVADMPKKISAYLGFPAEPWYLREFEAFGVHVHAISDTIPLASSGGRVGTVVDLLNTEFDTRGLSSEAGTCALTCGPQPMMKTVASWCEELSIPLRASLEARMGCGYGACVGCSIEVKADENADGTGAGLLRRKVCVDGPVFPAEKIVW
jgi:dihydroorotate dehydrogenase electron transfer subunit